MAKYSLADVHAAALDGSVELDESRALHTTTPLFATLLEVHRFAQDVLLSLAEEDWRQTVALGPPHDGSYDVYEKTLDAALCAKHGVESEWYVKLRLIDGVFGNTVFLVSLHQPERAFKRPVMTPKRGGHS